MRLRQAVLAARDLEETKRMLESKGLRDPFRDPGVKEFGLDNAVYPVGEASPPIGQHDWRRTRPRRTPSVRRRSCQSTRTRRQSSRRMAAKLRHPQMRAILSVDEPVPAASWLWGGPGWEERAVPGRLRGVDVGGADADAWSELLGRPVVDGTMTFDDDTFVRFARTGEGVTRIELDVGTTTVAFDFD